MIKNTFLGAVLYFGISGFCVAQVGINTTEPKAQLDIISTNPSSPDLTDGILIPRISNFPVNQPTKDQHGMLIFLEQEKTGFPEGFYFWNHNTGKWEGMSAEAASDFYKSGTTSPSGNVRDAIFRSGNTGIGIEPGTVKLRVRITPEDDQANKTGLEVDNANSATKHVTYGILSNNRSLTADKKYGIKNYVSADGEGIHYGIYNETYQRTNQDIYGIYNLVGKTFGATKNHFGIYSSIGSAQGTGMVYGIYSTATGNDPRKVYAGYFAGRIGIGLSPAEEYIFPAIRGVKDQVLALGDDGLVRWQYTGYKNYSSTTSATGAYVIPEEVYSLRVNNQLSSITIPDAASNKGRVIILLGWPGISHKPFNFAAGDDLLDITTNTQVTGIGGGQRLMIQSAGNRWLVIGR